MLIINIQGDQQGGTSLLQVKMQAAIVTRQRFERFQADVTRSQLILQAQMINVDGINIQLDVIYGVSIQSSRFMNRCALGLMMMTKKVAD